MFQWGPAMAGITIREVAGSRAEDSKGFFVAADTNRKD